MLINLKQREKKRLQCDCVGRADAGGPLRDANPLLLAAETLSCWFVTPRSVCLSLANLNASDSSMAPILTASLARTSRRHGPESSAQGSRPQISPQSDPRVARVTGDATLPVDSWCTASRCLAARSVRGQGSSQPCSMLLPPCGLFLD